MPLRLFILLPHPHRCPSSRVGLAQRGDELHRGQKDLPRDLRGSAPFAGLVVGADGGGGGYVGCWSGLGEGVFSGN